jgi:hypothetical protein
MTDKTLDEQARIQRLNTRQPAYDAVYAYIRELRNTLPPDAAHRNATIWRAVNAALDAQDTRAEAAIERVRAAVHIADDEDTTDWQRGYRACSVNALRALDEPKDQT